MQTPIRVRCVATGIKSPLEATRLIWADSANRGCQAAWSALTNGLELLTAVQVQQRFAAEGIEMTLDAAAELQIEAVIQRPSGVLPVISLNDKHAVATFDMRDSPGFHTAPLVVADAAIVTTGGAA